MPSGNHDWITGFMHSYFLHVGMASAWSAYVSRDSPDVLATPCMGCKGGIDICIKVFRVHACGSHVHGTIIDLISKVNSIEMKSENLRSQTPSDLQLPDSRLMPTTDMGHTVTCAAGSHQDC